MSTATLPRETLPARTSRVIEPGAGAPAAGHRDRAGLLRRLLVPALTAAGLLVGAVLSRDAVSAALATLSDVQWRWVALLLLAQGASTVSPAVTAFLLLRAAGARVRLPAVLAVTGASNAISLSVPLVGPELATAHTYRRLVRYGAGTAATAWTLLVSGVAAGSTFAVVAVAGLALSGSPAAGALAAGGAVLGVAPMVVLLALLRRPAGRRRAEAVALRALRVVRRVVRRPLTGTPTQLPGFLVQLGAHRLPRRDAVAVAGLALLNWLAEAAALALAVVAVGSAVPWQGLLLAYVAATAAAGLRLTPGGVGVVEAALTAALVAAGLDLPHALGAALLYRLVSYWLVVAVGWTAYASTLRRSRALRPGRPSPAPSGTR